MAKQVNPTGERSVDLTLRHAASGSDPKDVARALAMGADPNSRRTDAREGLRSPLRDALSKLSQYRKPGSLQVLQAILDAGARPNERDAQGAGPLRAAGNYNWPEGTALVIAAGADPNLAAHDGDTPLHDAIWGRACARSDPKGMIKTLINAGANPNAQGAGGLTPLHCAAALRDGASCAALLAMGADPEIRCAAGWDAVELCAQDIARNHEERPGEALALLTQARSEARLSRGERAKPKAVKPKKSERDALEFMLRDKQDIFGRAKQVESAFPNGQICLPINLLHIKEHQKGSSMEAEALRLINQEISERDDGRMRKALSLEPGLPGLAFSWESWGSEGGMWQESDFEEVHHAFAFPIRGEDANGNPCIAVAYGASHKGSRSKNAQKDVEKGMPLAALEKLRARLIEAPGFKAHEMMGSYLPEQLASLLDHAGARWGGFKALLSPARIEREALDSALPTPKARRAPGPKAL